MIPLPPPPKPVDLQLDKDVLEWQQLKDYIEKARAREKYLRETIAARMFDSIKQPNGAFKEGTSHTIATGLTARYGAKLGSTWKREVLEEMVVPTLTKAQLTPEEQAGLVKMNPVLSVTAYRLLPEAKRKIVDEMLVVKQGNVTLEISTLVK